MNFQLILLYFLCLVSPTTQIINNVCTDITNPSKENCNKIILVNNECCFLETTSEESTSECEIYNPELINYDSFLAEQLKDMKISTITLYLLSNDIESIDTNEIKSQLNDMLTDKVKIDCNSVTKEIDYSTIEYSEDDIAKAKQDNFCGKLMYSDEVSEEQCLNGVVFSDLEANGEKCCFVEISFEKMGQKNAKCLSLSQTQRNNEKYLESLTHGIERPFTAKIVCDGFS